MGTQIGWLLAGLTDTNGDDLSGGKVYSYVAGSATNKDTWTDKDETTLESNPIVLDAYGRSQTYANGWYKFVVKDSNDVTLYTWNNIVISNEVQNIVSVASLSVFVGTYAGSSITTGVRNVGIGYNSMPSATTASYSVAVGSDSLYSLTVGNGNTALGNAALKANVIGEYNVAIGTSALFKSIDNYNTGVGYQALLNNVNGGSNVSIGYNSMYLYDNAGYNVAIGASAGKNISGQYNICVGTSAGTNLTSGTYCIIIGNAGNLPSNTNNFQMNIGNLIYSDGIDGIGSTISSGNLGFRTSDQFGSGQGVFGIADALLGPTTTPTNGGVLYSDLGSLKYLDSGGTRSSLSPDETWYQGIDDFEGNVYNSGTQVGRLGWKGSSTLTITTIGGGNNNFGVQKLSLPATLNNIESLKLDSIFINTSLSFWDSVFIIRTDSNISTFAISIGSKFDMTLPSSSEVCFRYDSSVGTNWYCITRDAGVETSTDSGIAIAVDTWYKFKIRRTSIEIEFYIDGTLVATNTTNLPLSAFYPSIVCKTLAAVVRAVYVDYFSLTAKGLSR